MAEPVRWKVPPEDLVTRRFPLKKADEACTFETDRDTSRLYVAEAVSLWDILK
ncbi:MAG: hypothetical protein LBF75_02455 [Treponema sp.]|nr:hypothetical protein [Treponema sp.]